MVRPNKEDSRAVFKWEKKKMHNAVIDMNTKLLIFSDIKVLFQSSKFLVSKYDGVKNWTRPKSFALRCKPSTQSKSHRALPNQSS